MAIVLIDVQDRNNPTKTIQLKRYAIEPSDEPTAILFGKYSPFTGPKGHGRLIDFAKRKGIKKIAILMPERKKINYTDKYDANIFTPEQRIDIVDKAMDDMGIDIEGIFSVKASNPLGMFRNISEKISRPVFIVGPDRKKDFEKYFIEFSKNNKKITDVDDIKFGKGEMLAMTSRGDENTSGTEVRKSLVDNNLTDFIEMTGYSQDMFDYLRELLKKNKVINESMKLNFRDYFTRHIQLITEGGNVRLSSGEEAEKLDLQIMDKQTFTEIKEALIIALEDFSKEFEKENGYPLWKNLDKLIRSGKIFSGSTRTFFTKGFEEFRKYKPLVGDMDVQVAEEMMPELKIVLEKIKGKSIGEFKWLGFTNNGLQFNGLLETPKKWEKYSKYIQVDFEGTPFKDAIPTEFASFGHYSSWEDITHNVKGLFIKYLIQSLVSIIRREEIAIIGKSGKRLKRNDKIGFFAFSIDRGFRLKVEPIYDEDGEILLTDGLPSYREIPTKDSKYNQNLDEIFEIIFGFKPTENEKNSLFSFVRTLKIVDKELDDETLERLFNSFIGKLWGKGVQGLERNNPKLDEEIKDQALLKFEEIIPRIKNFEIYKEIEEMKEEFYKNYKMS